MNARTVIYMGTLAKVLAPGLRIGYVVAPAHVVTRIVALRRHIDRQGDHAVEGAVAELIEDGELERHAKRNRRIYGERREALLECLRREFGDQLHCEVPPGGLGLWARARIPGGVERFVERAAAQNVFLQHGGQFTFDGRPSEFLRLGFPCLKPDELRRAVRLLAQLARKAS
jgi:GntR family transcriptional regulator/MocR family aminotransferase